MLIWARSSLQLVNYSQVNMKKRKKHTAEDPRSPRVSAERKCATLLSIICLTFPLVSCLLLLCAPASSLMLLLKSNCLSNSPNCTCSWRSGKFVADCSAQNLTEVPKNDYYDSLLESSATENQMSTLNRDIQMLNLSFNSINHLSGGEFSLKKFRNLQKLYLSANKLASIAPSAFFKLTGLIELDLSDNLLTRIKPEPTRTKLEDAQQTNASESFLNDLGQLRQLNLNSNRLKRIEKFTFAPLVQLRQLYLSRNQITLIDKQAFDGLHVLNILHLDGNKLSYLNGEFIRKLPQLHALQLAGQPPNKWRCDCHLRKLVRLLLYKDGAQGALNAQQQSLSILQDAPRCFTRAGRTWPLQTGYGRPRERSDEKLADRAANEEEDQRTQDDNADEHDDQAAGRILAAPGDKSIRLADSIVRGPGDSHETLAGGSSAAANISGERRHWQDQRGADDERPQQRGEAAADDQFGPDGRLWTNMRLADFECAPEPAIEYLWPQPGDDFDSSTGPESSSSSDEPDEHKHGGGAHEADNGIISWWPSVGRAGGTGPATAKSVTLTRRHATVATSGEPLELTCASELADELDIELTRIEWFRWPVVSPPPAPPSGGDNKQQPRLLWASHDALRSSNNNNVNNGNLEMSPGDRGTTTTGRREIMMKMMKYDSDHDHHHRRQGRPANSTTASRPAEQLAVIDYVTRANGSERGAQAHRAKRLVRLVHLIHGGGGGGGQETSRALFLCRISNARGQLDLWYPVELSPGGPRRTGHDAARRPGRPLGLAPALESQLARESSLIRAASKQAANSTGVGWPRDRAQTLIRLELSRLDDELAVEATTTTTAPLFVPLHVMPRSLLLLAPRASRWRPTQSGQQKSHSVAGEISNSELDRPANDSSQMPGASLERSLTADERSPPVAARPATTLRQTGGQQHNESSSSASANHRHSQQTPLAADAAAAKARVTQIRDEEASSGSAAGGHLQIARTESRKISAAADGLADGGGVGVGGGGGETARGDYDEPDADQQPLASVGWQPDKLHDTALRLIGRFTSGERRPLDEMDDDGDQGGLSHRGRELASPSRGDRKPLESARKSVREMLAEAWHREDTTRARLLALYQVLAGQMGAPSSASSLPMLLVGIMAGCTLTSIFFLRLKCGARRRRPAAKRGQKVSDAGQGGGCAITSSEHDEEEEEEEDSEGHIARESRVWPPPLLAPPGERSPNNHIVLSSSSPDCPHPPASGSSGSTVTSTTAGSQRMLVTGSGGDEQRPRFASLPRHAPHMPAMMQNSRTMADFLGHRKQGAYCTPASGNYEHLMGGPGESATDDQFSPSCNSTATMATTTTTTTSEPTSAEHHELYSRQLDDRCRQAAELPLVANMRRQLNQHHQPRPSSDKTCTLGRNTGSLAARFINQHQGRPPGSGTNMRVDTFASRSSRGGGGQPARRTVTWLMSEAGDDKRAPCNELVNHRAEQQVGRSSWRVRDAADENNEQFPDDAGEHESCAPTAGRGGGCGGPLAHHQTIYGYAGAVGRHGLANCEQIYASSTRATANCARELSAAHTHHYQCGAGDNGAAPPPWCGAGEDSSDVASLVLTHDSGANKCQALQAQCAAVARPSGEHEYYLATRPHGAHELVTRDGNEICLLPADAFCLPSGDGSASARHLILEDLQAIYTNNLGADGQQFYASPPAGRRERDATAYNSRHFNLPQAAACPSSSSPNVTSSASSSTSRRQQPLALATPHNLTSQLDDALVLLQSSISQCNDRRETSQDRS